MGFFSKKLKYPELDSGNPAAEQVHEVEDQLQDLMGQVPAEEPIGCSLLGPALEKSIRYGQSTAELKTSA